MELREFSGADDVAAPGTLLVSPLKCPQPAVPGQVQLQQQDYVLESIRSATLGCLDGQYDAMVTGPVNKAAINQAGYKFSGHTEFIADLCDCEQPVMVLDNGKFRVALVTTHVPLSKVSSSITARKVETVVTVVNRGLQEYYGASQPAIVVCGLNPHAGEQGELGKEEINEIAPAIKNLAARGVNVAGPIPADTAFTARALENVDIVVAMYHDQGLTVLKSHGFGDAVNITFGLPIIRTSVDHGTALDLAATGRAESGSLERAAREAARMVASRSGAD